MIWFLMCCEAVLFMPALLSMPNSIHSSERSRHQHTMMCLHLKLYWVFVFLVCPRLIQICPSSVPHTTGVIIIESCEARKQQIHEEIHHRKVGKGEKITKNDKPTRHMHVITQHICFHHNSTSAVLHLWWSSSVIKSTQNRHFWVLAELILEAGLRQRYGAFVWMWVADWLHHHHRIS